MSEGTPKSVWDRVRHALGVWMGRDGDADTEVDEAELAFHMLFLAPVFLAFVLLVRR